MVSQFRAAAFFVLLALTACRPVTPQYPLTAPPAEQTQQPLINTTSQLPEESAKSVAPLQPSTPASITNIPPQTPEDKLLLGLTEHRLEAVTEWIASKPNFEQHIDKQTAITHALYQNFFEAVPLLLEAGALVDGKNADQNTPLMVALILEKPDWINFFLDYKADVNTVNFLGDTPLHFAVRIANVTIVERLLRLGANPDSLNGFKESPRQLSKRLAEKPGFAHQNILAMNALLNPTPGPNDNKLASAHLWQALAKANAEQVKSALEEGANPNIENAEDTPLTYALKRHLKDCVELLLASPHLAVDATDSNHNTPLIIAVSDAPERVQILLHLGANVNAGNRRGNTALHAAASRGNLELTKLLLAQHALLDSVNIDGDTPLMLAIFWKNANIADFLLQEGANVNCTNGLGNTALHIAIAERSLEMVTVLMNYHPDISIKNKRKVSCQLLAKRQAKASKATEEDKAIYKLVDPTA